MSNFSDKLDALNAADAERGYTARERRRARVVRPLAGLVAAGSLVAGGMALAHQEAAETRAKVVVSEGQPHREVVVGATTGDIDANPNTPDEPITTLWGAANAAKIPGVDPADVVNILGDQLHAAGKTAILQRGQVLDLPPTAVAGELDNTAKLGSDK